MHFGENQLSPGLIGLSPLSAAHPSGFHPTPVRASSRFYPAFTLATDRSPGFGSIAADYRPVRTRFPYGSTPKALSLADDNNSQGH